MGDQLNPCGIPRWAEATVALAALIVLSPLLLAVGALIALTSCGPVVFRQRRVGLGGCHFTLYKFRSMQTGRVGPQVTARHDSRVTAIGRVLRKTKLDELPELWNVVRGDMSLVGPRPEVPRYVDAGSPTWAVVLRARPGITDPVTLRLRNEEELLSRVEGDRERYYLEKLQPYKLDGYAQYSAVRSWRSDVTVILETLLAVFIPSRAPSLEPSDLSAANYKKA
jgi:lipopolysaccharide/colanic/teichoic acid biosynthesis glycosyltransferase